MSVRTPWALDDNDDGGDAALARIEKERELDLALGMLVDLYKLSGYAGEGLVGYDFMSIPDLGEDIIDMEAAIHA